MSRVKNNVPKISFALSVIGFSSAEPPTCPIDEIPACTVRCNGLVDRPICAVPDRGTGNSYTFASTCKMNIYNCDCTSHRKIFVFYFFCVNKFNSSLKYRIPLLI